MPSEKKRKREGGWERERASNKGVELASRQSSKRIFLCPLKFRPSTIVHQIFVEGPGASHNSLVARSKKSVRSAEVAERLSYAAPLRVQGRS